MTNKEKELLLKDLCARLPYGVRYNYGGYEGCDYTMNRISSTSVDDAFPIDDVKPFLRPMSSMTKEEKAIYSNYKIVVRGLGIVFEYNLDFVTEWLLKHHFDYRGLIEKGLAIEAPEGMYETHQNK